MSQLYEIINGETEYYSLSTPYIEKDKIICKQLIKKSSVFEEVMGERIEVFYKTEIVTKVDNNKKDDVIEFKLIDGIGIRLIPIVDLQWWNVNESDAKTLLKEKILQHYQKIVPNLIQNVAHLKEQIKTMQDNYNPDNNNIMGIKRKNFLIP